MTINYSCISDNDRRYRLPFGVPLEDIFPQRDLHPYLKKIFTKAYNDITSNGYSVVQVTCKFQGNVAERLILKEIVTSCKPMPLEFPPGALLWILRHFIGLLPLPLLPDYTNKEYFSWKKLSLFCKRSFLKYTPVEINNKLLIRKLAKDLLRLPPPNLLLFSTLVNFIRALSCAYKKNGKSNLDRVAAFCLVRYFSSSIFIRPFEPGRNGKIDRHYFPLLFYLVLKWSEIETYFGRKMSANSIPGRETSISLTYHPQSAPVRAKIKDRCTQTENNDQCREWLETISEESFDESFDFLRDAACQTVNVPTEYDNISYCPSCGEKNNKTLVCRSDCDEVVNYLRDTACQTEDYFIKCKNVRCCCRCGRNYSLFLQEDHSLNKYCQTNFVTNLDEDNAAGSVGAVFQDINTAHDKSLSLNKHYQTSFIEGTFDEARARNKRSIATITDHEFWHPELQTKHNLSPSLRTDVGTNTDDPLYYGWVSPAISSKSPTHKLDFCSPQTFVSANEYIYDDYTDSTLNLLEKTTEGTYAKNEEIDLLGRISKIGWTYTPPRSTCVTSPIESPTATSKTIMKEDDYSLCLDVKEGCSKEEKETCSSVNSLKSKSSIGSAKCKKSFSIANMKNRLDIFKFFTGKKNKLKNSCSFNEISNINNNNTDDPLYYGWVSPAISSKSPTHKLDFCSPQTFVSANEYIYDDYTDSTLNLLEKTTEGTYAKNEEIDLLGRISKIGWTYTPPRSTCVTSPIESPTATSKTIMKEDDYSLCLDVKEGCSKEEKETCSSVNSLKSKSSIGSAKCKKSFSIANMKNRLDIFKFFTGKKNKLKNSCSFNEISNIKYKKMNSVKSTLF